MSHTFTPGHCSILRERRWVAQALSPPEDLKNPDIDPTGALLGAGEATSSGKSETKPLPGCAGHTCTPSMPGRQWG